MFMRFFVRVKGKTHFRGEAVSFLAAPRNLNCDAGPAPVWRWVASFRCRSGLMLKQPADNDEQFSLF